jgi:ribosome-associated translation inhibitor RaiA
MVSVVFKNLEKSEFAVQAVEERMQKVLERFDDLKTSKINVTLSMENAPTQAGPDLFKVKFRSSGGKYKNIILEKSSPSLYAALAEVVDHLLERLNRFGDKSRVKNIREARKAKIIQQTPDFIEK